GFRIVKVVINESSMLAWSTETPPGESGMPISFQFGILSSASSSQVRYRPAGQTAWTDLGWCAPGGGTSCPDVGATTMRRNAIYPVCDFVRLTWQARVNTVPYGITPWTDLRDDNADCLTPALRSPAPPDVDLVRVAFLARPAPNPARNACALSLG